MKAMETPSATSRNVTAISRLEHKALAQRSVSERIGDAIASNAGKMWFIVFHIVWFTGWLWLNSGPKSRWVFDPFPFQLLSTIVSLESIFLSLFILMSQNRSSLQADQRNHLDLQINLLSEDENTKMLQMLRALCEHHKLEIARDPEIEEMTKRTEINDVLSELQDNLPTGE
jgi:uncharacterized membrane protein